MRISDWSSDVCSSDLIAERSCALRGAARCSDGDDLSCRLQRLGPRATGDAVAADHRQRHPPAHRIPRAADDRRSRHEGAVRRRAGRSEEHTSELQSLMRISYAVFCLQKKKHTPKTSRCQQKNTYHYKYMS